MIEKQNLKIISNHRIPDVAKQKQTNNKKKS